MGVWRVVLEININEKTRVTYSLKKIKKDKSQAKWTRKYIPNCCFACPWDPLPFLTPLHGPQKTRILISDNTSSKGCIFQHLINLPGLRNSRTGTAAMHSRSGKPDFVSNSLCSSCYRNVWTYCQWMANRNECFSLMHICTHLSSFSFDTFVFLYVQLHPCASGMCSLFLLQGSSPNVTTHCCWM